MYCFIFILSSSWKKSWWNLKTNGDSEKRTGKKFQTCLQLIHVANHHAWDLRMICFPDLTRQWTSRYDLKIIIFHISFWMMQNIMVNQRKMLFFSMLGPFCWKSNIQCVVFEKSWRKMICMLMLEPFYNVFAVVNSWMVKYLICSLDANCQLQWTICTGDDCVQMAYSVFSLWKFVNTNTCMSVISLKGQNFKCLIKMKFCEKKICFDIIAFTEKMVTPSTGNLCTSIVYFFFGYI